MDISKRNSQTTEKMINGYRLDADGIWRSSRGNNIESAAAAAAVMIIHLSVSTGRKKASRRRRSTSEMSSLDDVLSFIFVLKFTNLWLVSVLPRCNIHYYFYYTTFPSNLLVIVWPLW